MKSKIFTMLAIACIFSSSVRASDFIYFDDVGMVVEKASFMVEVGSVGGRIALKITYGYGVASKHKGFLFKEKSYPNYSIEIGHKLVDILDNPKTHSIGFARELPANLGLTLDTLVDANSIEPEVHF